MTRWPFSRRSRGAEVRVELRSGPFNPWRELEVYQQGLGCGGRAGAIASFTGLMRDFNEGSRVTRMTLEHYPGMTEKRLHEIAQEATAAFSLLDALLLHRTGRINIAEPVVLVAAWAAHRREAFEGCRHIMEALKSGAPFWKKEETPSGPRWVSKNTAGF